MIKTSAMAMMDMTEDSEAQLQELLAAMATLGTYCYVWRTDYEFGGECAAVVFSTAPLDVEGQRAVLVANRLCPEANELHPPA